MADITVLRLTNEQKAAARVIVARMMARRAPAAAPRPELYDEVYCEAMAALAEDETPVGLSGTLVRIA